MIGFPPLVGALHNHVIPANTTVIPSATPYVIPANAGIQHRLNRDWKDGKD